MTTEPEANQPASGPVLPKQAMPEAAYSAPAAGGAEGAASPIRKYLMSRGSGDVADRAFIGLMVLCALSIFGIVLFILTILIVRSKLSLAQFGLKFFIHTGWDPVSGDFGAWPFIFGTLATSFLALLMAVPLALGVAVFLTELCPQKLRAPISFVTELLAAIPSVVYGLWGVFVLVPLMRDHLGDILYKYLSWTHLFEGPNYGVGLLTASIILAIMVLPFVTSISRDVFDTVPAVLKESAYGIGCTTWEVVRNVVIPYTRVGVIGGVMLGLGRALGETMAVTFVIGNAHKISASILAPGTTISATIANEFTEAVGDLYTSSLIALGLILFVITFFVLVAARLLLLRLDKKMPG